MDKWLYLWYGVGWNFLPMEWISIFIPYFTGRVITYPFRDLS